jgi:hypothetical protein
MNSTIRDRQLLEITPTISRQAKEVPSLMENPSSARLGDISYQTNAGSHRIETFLTLQDTQGNKQKIEISWPFTAFRAKSTGANDIKVKIHTDEPAAKHPHFEKARQESRRFQLERLSGNQREQVGQHYQRQDAFLEGIRLRSGSWSASQTTISAKDLPAAVKSTLIAQLRQENPTNTHRDYLQAVRPEISRFLKALQA